MHRVAMGNNSTRPASATWAGGSAIAAQKPPIVADRRMLFAEYLIVGEKFQMSNKFVLAKKMGQCQQAGSLWLG
jgi:hypothetical protein